jgi:uncharacterized protein YaiI (UPF0178 family)
MISAKEAREKSSNNSFFKRELQLIETMIENACKQGDYFIIKDYTLYDQTIDVLEELGYKVTVDEGDMFYPCQTKISWDK